VVHSRSRGPVDELVAEGAQAASDPADVASLSDILIIMVSSTADLHAIFDAPQGGLLTGSHEGLIVVDMGSHDPSAIPGLAQRCAEAGVSLLDAPVSGGEEGAIQATLSIMVGGAEDALKRAEPVLATMGARIVHIGNSGAGMVAKACNQLVVGSTIEAVAEALNMARVAGVDASRVREALLVGHASSRVLDVHGLRMLERNFTPGARAAIHDKDATIIVELADRLDVKIPGFVPVAHAFRHLVEHGGADLDHSALITLLE
jgi:2-hydroxy-3-oxopropionate reductase